MIGLGLVFSVLGEIFKKWNLALDRMLPGNGGNSRMNLIYKEEGVG